MRKLLLLAIIVPLLIGGFIYWIFVAPNIKGKRITVKIPTGSSYEDVVKILKDNDILKSELTFSIVSNLKHYPGEVKAGYYVFNRNMNNRQIVNMLRLGLQTPVTLVIYNIRTKQEFAGLVGRTLEIDSNLLLAKLDDPAFCKTYGLDTNSILTHIILDNYECYWNTSILKLFEKLDAAYKVFWDKDRKTLADQIDLTPTQVTILASIVEKEVMHEKELPTVAGVYLNRLKKGMPLQADPTVVFALGYFSAKRVYTYYKDVESPYNTFKHTGLPPGPICIPYKRSIDAVLNAEQHQYLYFCANPDLSGYSLFSKTLDEQNKTATQYRKKLNAMHIH